MWGGAGPSGDRTDVRSDVRSLVRTDGRKFSPVFYRTSSPSGPLPKRMDGGKKFVLVLQEIAPFGGSHGGGLNCSNSSEIQESVVFEYLLLP